MARTGRTITVIPSTIDPTTKLPKTSVRKKRVAAYARVSTDSDEQFTSYEAQVDYYTKYILARPEWDFVKVYTDEGITGTNTKHRDGFKQMVRDALAGKIDLVVTKSVSRFARNTVDSLVTVRQLKEKGVEIFFEKENIYTLDSKGELLITIMSSLAQEESRSISQNVTWGQRKRFADGKVSMPYSSFLGYRKGQDGLPEIVPEEAEIVREIYSLYIQGRTEGQIAKQLTAEGVATPRGGEKWCPTTIGSILQNEKYKGDALLQKKFTVDFLSKKQKVNEGEVPQYYVENSHPAIIPAEEWQAAQDERTRRKNLGTNYSGVSVLSSRIICGECGSAYAPKLWHSTDKYRKVIWRCHEKYKGSTPCPSPTITEEEVKERFVAAVNSLSDKRQAVIDEGRIIQQALTDCGEIDRQLAVLQEKIEVVVELTQKCIAANSASEQDQEAFQERYDGYVREYEALKQQAQDLTEQREKRMMKANAIGGQLFAMSELGQTIEAFDENLWLAVIDKVIVHKDGTMTFRFMSGTEVVA